MKTLKCSWRSHGFDENFSFINEHKQVTTFHINHLFWKSLMVFVPNASWISYQTCLTFLWNTIGCTLQFNESGTLSVSSSAQTSCMRPRLCAVLSVITKSFFLTKSFSIYFRPDEAAKILNVISCKSFKLALVSGKICYLGSALCFQLIENDCTTYLPTLSRGIITVC